MSKRGVEPYDLPDPARAQKIQKTGPSSEEVEALRGAISDIQTAVGEINGAAGPKGPDHASYYKRVLKAAVKIVKDSDRTLLNPDNKKHIKTNIEELIDPVLEGELQTELKDVLLIDGGGKKRRTKKRRSKKRRSKKRRSKKRRKSKRRN